MIVRIPEFLRRLLASTAIAGLAFAMPVHATPLADDAAASTSDFVTSGAATSDSAAADADSEILVTAAIGDPRPFGATVRVKI